MKLTDNRIQYIDIARAFSIIWIVAIWHINQYLNDESVIFKQGSYIKEIGYIITNGVLALFTFISGYFLSQKEINTCNDVKTFYKTRLLRFAIPLFISCVLLCCIGYLSVVHIFTICFGISQLIPLPYPRTLWYFSMIILFYIISPVIILIRGKNRVSSGIFIILLYIVLDIGVRYVGFDKRVIDNYPFFVLPFIFERKNILYIFSTPWHWIISSIFFILLMYEIYCGYSVYIPILYSGVICFIILSFSKLLSSVALISRIFSLISFGSMFAYLYHRELYILFQKMTGKYNYIEAFIAIVVIFSIAYSMQYYYNRMINRINL